MEQLWQQQLHHLIYISSSFISNSTQILNAGSNSSTDSLYLNKQITMTNIEYNMWVNYSRYANVRKYLYGYAIIVWYN